MPPAVADGGGAPSGGTLGASGARRPGRLPAQFLDARKAAVVQAEERHVVSFLEFLHAEGASASLASHFLAALHHWCCERGAPDLSHTYCVRRSMQGFRRVGSRSEVCVATSPHEELMRQCVQSRDPSDVTWWAAGIALILWHALVRPADIFQAEVCDIFVRFGSAAIDCARTKTRHEGMLRPVNEAFVGLSNAAVRERGDWASERSVPHYQRNPRRS
eukprot:gene31535-16862_t